MSTTRETNASVTSLSTATIATNSTAEVEAEAIPDTAATIPITAAPTPLTPPVVMGLRAAQASFLVYQSAAFDERPASFFALELAGEAGELCNLEKKIWRNGKDALNPDRLADEAADVIITLLNYCNARGIDLEEAVRAKLKTIEDRRVRGLMGPVRSP